MDEEKLKPELTTEYQGLFYVSCSREYQEKFESDSRLYATPANGRHWLEDVEQGLDR